QPQGQWKASENALTGAGRILRQGEWRAFDLTVGVASAAEAGVALNWRGEGDHTSIVAVPATGKLEIRDVRGGKSAVVGSGTFPKSAKSVPLAVSQRAGRVRVRVDGREVAGAQLPADSAGAVGLIASGQPARFTRVEITKAQSPPPSMVHNRIFAGEDTMEAWASEGSDWQVTTAEPRTTLWHEGEHWDDCSIRYALPEPGAAPGKMAFVVRGDGKNVQSGCWLLVEPQAKGGAKLSLFQQGVEKPVGVATAPAALSSVGLAWRARSAVVVVDGKPVLSHRCATPPAGRRIALWTEGWQPALAQTKVDSENVIDDYFEAAAVDWCTDCGEWAMQNRWTCSPQWSWLGGGGADVGMLWNKRRFRGDIRFDVYAAFQMRKIDGRIYRPRDLNATICSDGRNPSTGYTLIYGGWLNTATSLLRNGKVVATTTAASKRPPGILDTIPHYNYLHRKWWHVAMEKQGSKVACYVDDQLLLEYEDPDPLPGGQVCIWTHNNYIMIARSCVSFEHLEGVEDPVLPLRPAAPAAPAPPVVATSHGGVFDDFEQGMGKWSGPSDLQFEARGMGLALAVTNPHAGGAFDVKFPITPYDALAVPRLTFDCRMDPGVKVNLHVTANGRTHAVVLTNPEAHPANVPVIGRAAIVADGKWHTVDVDLRAMLLRCTPDAAALQVEAIWLGTQDRANYLTAGFGGNQAGLVYRLDNVRLWAPGPAEAAFTWDPKLVVSHAFDQKPDTAPDDTPEPAGALKKAGLASGAWYFHIKAKDAKGQWSRAAHLPVTVDVSPPTIANVQPANGSKTAVDRVVLDFVDESGIDPKSIVLTVAGHPQPVMIVPGDPARGYAPPAVSYDPVERQIVIDLARVPLALKDGQAVKVTATAKDYRGLAMAAFETTWTHETSQDKTPPVQLKLDGSHPYLCVDDFESGLGQWRGTPEYSVVERDSTTKASGDYSLRVYNPYGGGTFATVVRSAPFDAGRYPIVAFDYKVGPNVRADLVLAIGSLVYTVRFTDPHGTHPVGAIPGIQTDNQWHHTEFNLHEMLTAALPKASTYVVNSLQFADTGYYGNARGVEFHIDNFCIAPAVSTRLTPLEWRLTASDPSGITAWQHSLTSLPGAIDWKDSATPAWKFSNLGAGIFHFRVRAKDGAGNWSLPLDRKLLIDDQPPTIRTVSPAEGARSADAAVKVVLDDAPSGVNRDKTILTIDGTPYTTTTPGVTYNARSHAFQWRSVDLPKPAAIADGKVVKVTLKTEDNVGNSASRSWTWRMDYSLDKT
ncbi:hypothetical protein HQ560_04165, partial [bacterium]|nr:hypothetical protein [bacterium]